MELVLEISKDLTIELRSSPLPEKHELKQRAREAVDQSSLILGGMASDKKAEVKPVIVSGKSSHKLKYLDVPQFDGRMENWHTFWEEFEPAVHGQAELDVTSKLIYLKQAIQDQELKLTVGELGTKAGAYEEALALLNSRFDKQRSMHRKYCEQMKAISPADNTRMSITKLADSLSHIWRGWERLEATDGSVILTSMAELVMSKELKHVWYTKTTELKKTPPLKDLIAFLRTQADQAEGEEEHAAHKGSHDRNKSQYQEKRTKPFHQKYKASSNVTVNAAPPRSNPQRQQQQNQSTRPEAATTSYACTLCQESHQLFYCPIFEAYSVAQRKEHVMSNKLCLNCMKPNHIAQECRSTHRCKANSCGRKYNTLLHEDRPAAPVQQNSHQSNAVMHSDESEGEELQECLLMTSQVTVTGPTGKYLTVRTLLDSGSTLSILSTKALKYLDLKDTGRTVSISGIASKSTNQKHPLCKVILTSDYQPEWSKGITVAGMKEVTRQMPLQEAEAVRELPHIRNLELADKDFDKPGRIDLLLGQDVCRQLFLPGVKRGTEKEPEAWLTVFGWTISGTYSTSSQAANQPAITHVVSAAPETEMTTDQILRRFF